MSKNEEGFLILLGVAGLVEAALFASLAVMMTYLIILKLSISNYQLTITRIVPAVVAALLFAFSTTFWEQAVIAEKCTIFPKNLICFKYKDEITKCLDIERVLIYH